MLSKARPAKKAEVAVWFQFMYERSIMSEELATVCRQSKP